MDGEMNERKEENGKACYACMYVRIRQELLTVLCIETTWVAQ